MATWPLCQRGMMMLTALLGLLLCPEPTVGRTVTVTSIKVASFLMEVRDNTTGNISYEGFIPDLLQQLKSLTKLDFRIESLADEFGALDNGQWSGLIAKLVKGEAEMAAAPLTLTSERARVMDYSFPFQSYSGVIVMRHAPLIPTAFSDRVLFIFRPLEDTVWLAMGVTYLLTGLILYIICHVNPYEWRQMCTDHLATRREAESFTCLNTYWFLLSTFMWQGFIRAPRSLGGRLVVTVWWTFVVVVLLTYTASLTNLLRAVPPGKDGHQEVPRIFSLKDLEAESLQHVDVGFVRGGATADFLKHATASYLRRLYSTVMDRGTDVPTVEEGIARVRQSYGDNKPFAFVTESTAARHLVRQSPCDLFMVPHTQIQGAYSLGFKMNSDVKDAVDLALLQLQENGILSYLEHKWMKGACRPHVLDPTELQQTGDESYFYPVNLGSFSGILLILAAGVILGAIVTVVEIIVFKLAEKTPESEAAKASRPSQTKGDNMGKEAKNVSSAV